MEKHLTLPELNLLLKTEREREEQQYKRDAALQGIDLDGVGTSAEDDFERIQMRANAAIAGQTEEEYFFDIVGIEIENDED